MTKREIVLLVGLIAAVVEAGLAVPLIMKKVRPNSLYGLPRAARYESRRTWYRANRSFGWLLVAAAALSAIATVLIWVIKPHPASTKEFAGVEALVLIVPFLVALAAGSANLRRVA